MTYNLQQHNSQTGRHERDVVTNRTYAICKAMKSRLELAPKMPGTYFKIVPNQPSYIRRNEKAANNRYAR